METLANPLHGSNIFLESYYSEQGTDINFHVKNFKNKWVIVKAHSAIVALSCQWLMNTTCRRNEKGSFDVIFDDNISLEDLQDALKIIYQGETAIQMSRFENIKYILVLFGIENVKKIERNTDATEQINIANVNLVPFTDETQEEPSSTYDHIEVKVENVADETYAEFLEPHLQEPEAKRPKLSIPIETNESNTKSQLEVDPEWIVEEVSDDGSKDERGYVVSRDSEGLTSVVERTSCPCARTNPVTTAKEAAEQLSIPWTDLHQFKDLLEDEVKRKNLQLLLDNGLGGDSLNHFAAQLLSELFDDKLIQRMYKTSPPGHENKKEYYIYGRLCFVSPGLLIDYLCREFAKKFKIEVNDARCKVSNYMYNERTYAKLDWKAENKNNLDRNGDDRDLFKYIEIDEATTSRSQPHIINEEISPMLTVEERVAIAKKYEKQINDKFQKWKDAIKAKGQDPDEEYTKLLKKGESRQSRRSKHKARKRTIYNHLATAKRSITTETKESNAKPQLEVSSEWIAEEVSDDESDSEWIAEDVLEEESVNHETDSVILREKETEYVVSHDSECQEHLLIPTTSSCANVAKLKPATSPKEAAKQLSIPWTDLYQFEDLLKDRVKRANLQLLLDHGMGGASINQFPAQLFFELFNANLIQRMSQISPPGHESKKEYYTYGRLCFVSPGSLIDFLCKEFAKKFKIELKDARSKVMITIG